MNKIPRCWLLAVALAFPPAAAAPASETPRGVNLADLDGWTIVVGDDAIPSERYAAEELQRFLAEATGRRLPLTAEADQPEQTILVGPSKAMRRSRFGFSVDSFGPEDLRILIRDDQILIAGGRPRGTLYGVYAFLEDWLGVRFLTADHTHVPPVGAWRTVGPVDRFYHPPLEMRWSYYGETNRQPEFAARLRINTVPGDAKLGGRAAQRLINHSFFRQIPTATYGKEHPEYFALRNGRRILGDGNDAHQTQPCLTHPDVLRIVTEAVLRELDSVPPGGNVSVSQNDNANYCQCPRCAAIDQREGTPMGSLLTFVNAVADAVAQRRPDVKVGTLAYWYSRKPPKTIRPRPNVQIQLCSIECCLLHPIDDPTCPQNLAFRRDMAGWGEICDNVYIWNYNTNFSNYLLPCPNLRVIEPNIRYFAAHGAKGVFMQAAGNAWGAELSDLRNYVMSRLLWDPSLSGERLIDEFLDLHYGRAAGPIREFIRRTHDRAAASGKHHNCFGRLADYGLDASDAEAGVEAFEEALRLAESDAVRARVAKASICAYRAALEPVWYRSEGPLAQDEAERLRPIAGRFFQLCREHGVDRPRESREDIGQAERRLRGVFGLADGEPW